MEVFFVNFNSRVMCINNLLRMLTTKKKTIFIAGLFVWIPVFLYISYIVCKLDSSGGIYEYNEVSIKLFLSVVTCIGSIWSVVLYVSNRLLPKRALFIALYLFMIILSLVSFAFIYGFRHGVGF